MCWNNVQSTEIQNRSGIALLRYYTNEWNTYTTGVKHIDRVLNYFNRHWLDLERQKGRKDVYPVRKVSPTYAYSGWARCQS